jgi:hypothetical protein
VGPLRPADPKAVLRAITERVTCYPESTGYVLVADWSEGGRAAARIVTAPRRKLYTVPEEILTMFAGDERGPSVVIRSMEASLWTNRLSTVRRLAEVHLDVNR